MTKVIEVASYSYPKNAERINQDSILLPMSIDDGVLFAIADGVGSYRGGDIASQTAINYLSDIKTKNHLTVDLEKTFSEIRDCVAGLINMNPDYKNAATTLTAGFINPTGLYIGHVGDCRLYIKSKNNKLVQITKDHTKLQEMVDEKLYSKKFLQDKKVKNILTTAIASHVEMKVDFYSIPICDLVDDKNNVSIFLMSDGVHKYWDKRPRFSLKTINDVARFSSSLKRRIEFFAPSDDYSLVALTVNCEPKM